MQNGPKMKWTFMSLQILDDVRQGKMTFAEMFPRARAAGFVAYDASDMDAEFASREEVLALCRDAGLRIADYIHWVHMTDPDEAGVQAAIESGKQAVHTALAHGTHRLMIVENVVPEDLARMTREEAAEKMTRALRSIVEYAADYGVTVMVEDFPSPLLPMATSAQMRKLLDGAPGLRLILDTGNMLAQGESPVEFAEKLADEVAHVHLKDIEYPENATTGDVDCEGRRMWNAQHGEGVVDFGKILPLLKSRGFDGYVTVEYGPHEGTQDHFEKMAESIRYLEELI